MNHNRTCPKCGSESFLSDYDDDDCILCAFRRTRSGNSRRRIDGRVLRDAIMGGRHVVQPRRPARRW